MNKEVSPIRNEMAPKEGSFTPERSNSSFFKDMWEKVVEIKKRFSHQQFENMPRLTTVNDLIETILNQNPALTENSDSIIDLTNNPKQYLVGIEESKIEGRVKLLSRPKTEIYLILKDNLDSDLITLKKNTHIRFTMVENELLTHH